MTENKRPLKILLVTSELTYIPKNYLDLFSVLLDRVPEHLFGLVLLKNFDKEILKTTAGIFALGCHGIAKNLVTNISQLPLKKRERLFLNKNIPTFTFKSMNEQKAIDLVKKYQIDLIINLRTRCIYKKEILMAPRLGCINIHHGLLPQYRGTMCDLYALSENREAGFSIHVMNEKIDDGHLLRVHTVAKGLKNYPEYLKLGAKEEGEILADLIQEIYQLDKIPEGTPNFCEDKVYTKNPNYKKIKDLKKQGMVL